ncbi:MAG: translation elongation factor Ts [Eubacteriaceae bacterium]|jgi:elongation factor Ts|nr:translation elongation factor Ts [Eubacteriaceae bacterium]
MAIKAQQVKELREITGAGMMDCKKALEEADADIDKAIEVLREKGLSKVKKKEGRIAAEGLAKFAIAADGKSAAVVEVNSETDFVAKNQEFIDFVERLAKLALDNDAADMDAFKALDFGPDGTVDETLTQKISKIGENMNIRRFEKVAEPGVVYSGYLHNQGKIAVLVGIQTEAAVEEVAAVGKDVAMQVASMKPEFLDESQVDQAYLDHEKEILKQEVLNEGKKPEMADRIVEGKIKKELKEVCLVDQKFVKDNDVTIEEYVANSGKAVGKDMKVASYIRYEVGEGIEKRQDDFAAEVAAQAE